MRAKKIISINNIIVAAIKKMMSDLTSNILTKDLYKMPVRHIFNLGGEANSWNGASYGRRRFNLGADPDNSILVLSWDLCVRAGSATTNKTAW